MKDECDKLAAQLSTKEEAHALLHRKYQLLKQEVEDKVSLASLGVLFPNSSVNITGQLLICVCLCRCYVLGIYDICCLIETQNIWL